MNGRYSLKETLRKGLPCCGGWCQIGHPAVAEIQAQAGFQWLALDCEHGEASEQDIGDFCRAALGGGAEPLVRVRQNDILDIRRALDLGAVGVIVPLVNNAADASRAVAAALIRLRACEDSHFRGPIAGDGTLISMPTPMDSEL